MVSRLLISSGYGPPECQVAVARLVLAMSQEAGKAGLKVATIEQERGPYGLLSALLEVDGIGVETFVQGWVGTVRWICPSPVRPNVARKNWFVAISAAAAPSERKAVLASDLKIQRLRASGPGGQHVNKTESAVRVTHIPTGLSVVSRDERSQHRNRALAEKRIVERLGEKAQIHAQQAEAVQWGRHSEVERGAEIRTYVGPEFRRKV